MYLSYRCTQLDALSPAVEVLLRDLPTAVTHEEAKGVMKASVEVTEHDKLKMDNCEECVTSLPVAAFIYLV